MSLSLTHVLLFVKEPSLSAAFYSKILGIQPLEQSKTFALFELPNKVLLGLWSDATAKPEVAVRGGGNEICFQQESDKMVLELYHTWVALGVEILLEPTTMDGMSLTFVAKDSDGHRIRVLCLE